MDQNSQNDSHTMTEIVAKIKKQFPKLYVTTIVNNDLQFKAEDDTGWIEYKKNLTDCHERKRQKYATQMLWRITENVKNHCAIYYIGVNDNGTIAGLISEEILDSINKFMMIANCIEASVTGCRIITIQDKQIVKMGVKIKKIENNYEVQFADHP